MLFQPQFRLTQLKLSQGLILNYHDKGKNTSEGKKRATT